MGSVRSGLTWNHANEFAGGVSTPTQGLTERGRSLVRRLGELGVILDLAHASEQTWRDVLAEGVPFSVTHAGCRAVCDHPRNLADWQLEALAECGGVVGMMAIPFSVDPEAPTFLPLARSLRPRRRGDGDRTRRAGADFIDQATPIERDLSPRRTPRPSRAGRRAWHSRASQAQRTTRRSSALFESVDTTASGSKRS